MSLARTLLILPLALGLMFNPTASAQIRSATITDSVLDQSGSAVPNAQVEITNSGTNASYQTQPTHTGQLTMPYLGARPYTEDLTVRAFAYNHDARLMTA